MVAILSWSVSGAVSDCCNGTVKPLLLSVVLDWCVIVAPGRGESTPVVAAVPVVVLTLLLLSVAIQ